MPYSIADQPRARSGFWQAGIIAIPIPANRRAQSWEHRWADRNCCLQPPVDYQFEFRVRVCITAVGEI